MRLLTTYYSDSEFLVVQETLADLAFIVDHDYDYWLPEGITVASSTAAIRQAIAGEFDESVASTTIAAISRFYTPVSDQLERFVSRFIPPPADLDVTITRYGVGGYYEAPNRIIINLRSTWDTPQSTLLHELVHLAIEPTIVARLNLDHAAKEGLVDYLILHDPLLHRLVPYYHVQDQTTPPTPELIQFVMSA